MKYEAVFEIIVNAFFIFLLSKFLSNHFGDWKFFIPALILHIGMILDICWNVFKIHKINKIDYQKSIAEAQKNQEELRLYIAYKKNSLYVVIPLFSAIFLIVPLKAAFDYDAYRLGFWFIGFIVGSFAVAGIIAWFLKKFFDKNLIKAQRFLEEIRELEVSG